MSHRSAVPTAVLRCFASDRLHDASVRATVCEACGLPLRVDLDLPVAAPERCIRTDVASLWRYARQLPVAVSSAITLGEGWTRLVDVGERVWIKDEARALQRMQRSERQLRLGLDAHRPAGPACRAPHR